MTPADETRSIVRQAAELYGVTVDDMFGPSKRRDIVAARSEAVYQVYRAKYDRGRWSLVKIGKLFGMHHTTVRLAVGRAAHARGDSSTYVRVYEKNLLRERIAQRLRRTKSGVKVANVVDSRISDEIAS
jgi:chromosomal replication initiation ATPase DnaA